MREETDPNLKVLDDGIERIRKAHKEIDEAYADYHKLVSAFYAGVHSSATINNIYHQETKNNKREATEL